MTAKDACLSKRIFPINAARRDAVPKTKTKREAIVKAFEEVNRRHSQAELVKYFGKFESLMTNEEIEAMEEDDWKSWSPFPKDKAVSKKKK